MDGKEETVVVEISVEEVEGRLTVGGPAEGLKPPWIAEGSRRWVQIS